MKGVVVVNPHGAIIREVSESASLETSFPIQLTHPALIALDTLIAVLMLVVWTAAAKPILITQVRLWEAS